MGMLKRLVVTGLEALFLGGGVLFLGLILCFGSFLAFVQWSVLSLIAGFLVHGVREALK